MMEEKESLWEIIAGIFYSMRIAPWQSLIQIIAIICMFPAFFSTVFFFVAEPRSEIIKKGYTIPLNWEAGVMNHGEYFEWYLMSEHPYYFTLSIGALITSWLILIYYIWRRNNSL